LHADAVRLPPDPASADVRTRANVNLGQIINAGLDYAGDKDWYRVRLEQGHSYRFALNGGEGNGGLGDPMLRVLGANGTELATDDDDGAGLNSYLEFTPTETGAYFLEVRGFGDDATGTYSLSAKEGDIPASASTDAALAPDGD